MSDYELEPWLEKYAIKYNPTRRGNQMVLCPNPEHDDRTPSTSVHLDKKVWNCQACGCGGTAIDLIMTVEGVGLREAFGIAEAGTPEGGGQVSQQPGRSELGLPSGSRVHRGNGDRVQAWKGFGT